MINIPPTSSGPVVRSRADAQRNRQRLIEAARDAYGHSDDGDAPVSMEGIARSAGVGIGTLYRHFPSREALVEAVYEAELNALTTLESGFTQTPADIALRDWMARYARFISAKKGMIEALRAGWASGTITTPTTRERVNTVISSFLAVGVRQGVFRDDVAADDISAALLGVFLSTTARSTPGQIDRLLDLLVAGMQSH